MPAVPDQKVITMCPRCGGMIPDALNPGAYPGALSRWDTATEICSDCGLQEAVLDHRNGGYRDGGSSWLDPYTGEELWVKPEVALTTTEIVQYEARRIHE